jgi:phosphoadenosine phosphosulfate reductase
MLIKSDKHTKEDLQLWNSYEEMDKINSQKLTLIKKEKKAIECILYAYKNYGYCGVSWGKDSTVIAHLIYKSELNIPVVWIKVNPIFNPQCIDVRDNFLNKFNIKYEEIEVNCRVSKYDVHATGTLEAGFKKAIKKYGAWHISGVRGDESNIRTLIQMKYGLATEKTLRPISYWSAEEVFAYLYKYDLPVHPSYAMLAGGLFDREYLRVASISGKRGNGLNRELWENMYYKSEIIKAKIKKH